MDLQRKGVGQRHLLQPVEAAGGTVRRGLAGPSYDQWVAYALIISILGVAGFSAPVSIGRKRGGTVEPYLDFYGDAALAVISC